MRAFEGLDKAGALVRSGLFGFGRDGDITAAYEARGLEQEQEDEQVEPGEEGGLEQEELLDDGGLENDGVLEEGGLEKEFELEGEKERILYGSTQEA